MKFKLPKLTKPKLLKFPKLPKFPNFPKIPHLPLLNLKPVNKILSTLLNHKVSTVITISFLTFISFALWYRGHLLSQMNSAATNTNTSTNLFNSTSHENPLPTIELPSPDDTNSTSNTVLGTSDVSNSDSNSGYNTLFIASTPFPTFPPLPTLVPIQNTNTSSTGGNSSGNSNCTTGTGVPNSWYSDVYPNPPITTNTGSVQLVVTLRDCNVQTAPVNDTLTISLSSGDPNTQVNGNNLPYSLTASNSQTSFYVTSQVSGSVTLVVTDTTRSFTVTDINNHNPTITFTGSGSSSSGNSNCTTGAGVSNAWYSDVYPASPVSANTGSTVTFTVIIRDCNKNTVSASDNLTFSQSSNDSSLTVNGSAPPVSLGTQNGQATFSVSSQNAGTDTFTIQDTTGSFTITDANNHHPSVVFSGSSTTIAPTSTPAPTTATNTPTSSPTSAPTSVPTQSATSTPAPTQSNSPTPMPTPNPTGS